MILQCFMKDYRTKDLHDTFSSATFVCIGSQPLLICIFVTINVVASMQIDENKISFGGVDNRRPRYIMLYIDSC